MPSSIADALAIQHIAFGKLRMCPPLPRAIQDTAVPVVGVFAETDIRDHRQVGYSDLDHPHCLLDHPAVIEALAAVRILGPWNPEQQNGPDAEAVRRFDLRSDPRDGPL